MLTLYWLKLYGHHHKLVERYDMSVCKLTIDMFSKSELNRYLINCLICNLVDCVLFTIFTFLPREFARRHDGWNLQYLPKSMHTMSLVVDLTWFPHFILVIYFFFVSSYIDLRDLNICKVLSPWTIFGVLKTICVSKMN